MKRICFTMDLESWDELEKLPVSMTRDFKLGEREFCIVDKDEFNRICSLAKLKTVPTK